MGISRMSGTPWHIEKYTRDGDDRRHRSRCVYYVKSSRWCNKINENCWGSAHCPYYQADASKMTITKAPDKSSSHKNTVTSKTNNKPNPLKLKIATVRYTHLNQIQLNDRVYHKRFGLGWIKSKNERNINVVFDNGVKQQFSIEHCISSGVIQKTKSI